MIRRSARIAAGLGVGLAAIVAVPAGAVLSPAEADIPDSTVLPPAQMPVDTPACELSQVGSNLRVVVDDALPEPFRYSVSFQWQQNQAWTEFDSGTAASVLDSKNAPENETYRAAVTYPDGNTTLYCAL